VTIGRCATLGWDFTNRLQTHTEAAGQETTYRYDPFGRRIQKSVDPDGAGGSPAVTTWYVWDGDMLLGEYDASGGRDVRYAYAGGFAPVQVAYDNGSGEDVYDVHTDHLDTPRLLTDDTGAVAWQSSHEAYGRRRSPAHSAPGGPSTSRGSTTTPRPACTTTGSGTTTRRSGGTSVRTRSGRSGTSTCIGMRWRTLPCSPIPRD
jgi:YD repeat-containing protein